MNQFLHFVAAITLFCMSAKHNVSGHSTFYIALKTHEKSTHFMLTHVIMTSEKHNWSRFCTINCQSSVN